MTKRDLQNQIDALREQIILANGRIRALEYDFNRPTADVVERKKGKWIYLDGLDAFECSVCGRQMVRNIFEYCPWCGAVMDERSEDDD